MRKFLFGACSPRPSAGDSWGTWTASTGESFNVFVCFSFVCVVSIWLIASMCFGNCHCLLILLQSSPSLLLDIFLHSLSCSPDFSLLVSSSHDGTIKTWRTTPRHPDPPAAPRVLAVTDTTGKKFVCGWPCNVSVVMRLVMLMLSFQFFNENVIISNHPCFLIVN